MEFLYFHNQNLSLVRGLVNCPTGLESITVSCLQGICLAVETRKQP